MGDGWRPGEAEIRKIEEKDGKSIQRRQGEWDAALEQKKSQLEKDNAVKIFTLEKDRRDLEKTKGGIKEQVKQLTKERDQEMQIREAIQKTITDMTSKYKVDQMPWDY
jgi:hypothetical protein